MPIGEVIKIWTKAKNNVNEKTRGFVAACSEIALFAYSKNVQNNFIKQKNVLCLIILFCIHLWS